MTRPKLTEHAHQVALFRWAKLSEGKYPMLKLMYAVPNAGLRTPRMGSWMKAEGLRPGVPDVCLPWPSGGYHGLYLELKAEGGKLTKGQEGWLQGLLDAGYCAECAYGWEDAKRMIEGYLKP